MENAELIAELQGIYPLNDYEFQNAMLNNFRGFQDMCGEAADALEATDKRVKELVKAQRWIPVEERLPTVSEYRNGDRYKSMDSNELVPFLVCCEDTEIPFRAFYDGKSWGDGWGKQNVTHWQPLPQPPQKGE